MLTDRVSKCLFPLFLLWNKSHKIFKVKSSPLLVFTQIDFSDFKGFFVCARCLSLCLRLCCCVRKSVSVHVCMSERERRREVEMVCVCVCHCCTGTVFHSKTLSLKQDSPWQGNITRVWCALSLKVNHCLWLAWEKLSAVSVSHLPQSFSPSNICHKMFW